MQGERVYHRRRHRRFRRLLAKYLRRAVRHRRARQTGHGPACEREREGEREQEDRKKSDQSSRSEKRKISRCSFSPSLPLSLPPSSIRTSSPSSLNSGRQRVIYCAAKEREGGRVGGLQRPADYVTPPVVRISPRHNTTAVASASSPTNSAAVCVYCSGVINGTHLAPRVPDGAERQGRQRRAGAGASVGEAKLAEYINRRLGERGRERVPRLSIRPRRRPSALFLMIVLEWFVAAGSR